MDASNSVSTSRDEPRNDLVVATDRTVTPHQMQTYWRAAIGDSYRPVKWGVHQAAHPLSVKATLARLAAGEPCPEAADVIVALVHSQAVAWNQVSHLSAMLDQERSAARYQIIKAMHDRNVNHAEIGRHLSLSRERIRQILNDGDQSSRSGRRRGAATLSQQAIYDRQVFDYLHRSVLDPLPPLSKIAAELGNMSPTVVRSALRRLHRRGAIRLGVTGKRLAVTMLRATMPPRLK